MAPELVVADSPYTEYPGGVVAVRCADFLGGARGTLSTEADSRSCTGTVVRDSQTVTTVIRTAGVAAFQEADDTLEIDVSDLPLIAGTKYGLFVSHLIEGDWDVTNVETTARSNANEFGHACRLGMYGTAIYSSDSDFGTLNAYPRHFENYITANIGGQFIVSSLVGNEVLHFRAYAQSGTSIEWLLDQLVFIPLDNDFDWIAVPGAAGDFVNNQPDDGVDGGDANGKYTWQPYPEITFEVIDFSGADAGGDWQQKSAYSGAEYMLHIEPAEEGYYLFPAEGDSGPVHAYSLHGIYYRPAETLVDDDFSRTINAGLTEAGSAWYSGNKTPAGFQATGDHADTGGGPTYCAVDGSKGIMHMGGQIDSPASCTVNFGRFGLFDPFTAAQFRLSNNLIVSGKFRIDNLGSAFMGPDTVAGVYIRFMRDATFSDGPNYSLRFNLESQTWEIRGGGVFAATDFRDITSPVDISSWFTPDSNPSSWVGFKFEFKRYLIRAKVWDATSGSEPGSWSASAFRPIKDGTTWYDYPYTTHPENYYGIVPNSNEPFFVALHAGHTHAGAAITTWEVHWDDLVIETDPYGDAEDVHAAIEYPHEGTKRGEITIPHEAWHFVYWGFRKWTDLDSFGDPHMDFSTRLWNDPAGAELQRSEAPFWYFRGGRFTLVSMNWRSSDRQTNIHRIHVGEP